MIDIKQGDCLELMKEIPNESIDMILCDPPYGTTKCRWDKALPIDVLWREYNRIIKPNSAICLFGTEPFSSQLRLSNLKGWKYDWIWHKSKCGSAFTSKYRPQQKHETISVFSKNGEKTRYFPVMREGTPYTRTRKANTGERPNNHNLGVTKESTTINNGFRYPETVIYFQQKWRRQDQLHPTQKPVALLEYLIKTYTNEGETVLDNCMGSGSTGVACINTGRNFIGYELDEKYFEIAEKRLNECVETTIFDK